MLIIPRAEAPALLAKHSAKLLEDGRMSQAARLAAQQERILKDPLLADDEAVQRVKPVSRRLRRAVKKLRQLDTQPLTVGEQAAQDQELVTPAFTKWMQRMVRQQKPSPPGAPVKKEAPPPPAPWGVSSPLKRPAPAEPAPKKSKRKQEAPKPLEALPHSRKKAGPPIAKPKEPPPQTGAAKRKQKKPKRLRRPRLSEETKEKISGSVGKALKKSLSKSWKKW